MRLFRPGLFARIFFPGATFRIRNSQKALFLTFDDGPDPGSTPGLIDILNSYNVKALFFCSGRNAEKHPALVSMIRMNGHRVGNHGYDHLDGWFTGTRKYLQDVSAASVFTSDSLFRPPYGRIRLKQYRHLAKTHKIVFWDLMPYDFDLKFGDDRSFNVLKNKIRSGSVVVLHDSVNSSFPLFLSRFIEYAIDEGYAFLLPE